MTPNLSRCPLLLIAAILLVSCDARQTVTEPDAPAATAGPFERTAIAIDGFGPIKIGMTITDAEKAADMSLNVAPPSDFGEGCTYGLISVGQAPLRFMVSKGVIARIDVNANSPLTTAAGAHVGSSEADIKRLYANVAVTPHKYEDGNYLTVSDPAHTDFRYVFETDGRVVTRYRAGRVPEVELVEGCS